MIFKLIIKTGAITRNKAHLAAKFSGNLTSQHKPNVPYCRTVMQKHEIKPNMKNSKLLIIVLATAIAILSCKKESDNGKNSLTNLVMEPSGENCVSGGFKITVGIDQNNNAILDENEIQGEEYICNGTNGNNSLINVTSEQPGTYCSYGGIKIESGLDANSDGLLEEIEIQSINFICNGENGESSGEINAIRIPFNIAYKGRNPNLYWTSEIEDGLLSGFNIEDYSDFTSVEFIAQFHRYPAESTDTIWLRLYDYELGLGIPNSQLFSVVPNSQLDDPDNRLFKSDNFRNYLLPGDKTIGIQFKSESNGMALSLHKAELLLRRNQ